MKDHEFQKYLRKNPAPRLFPRPLAPEEFSAAVVIPVCNENEYLGETLASLRIARTKCAIPVAVILVVNHPPDAAEPVRQASLSLLEQLRRHAEPGVFWMDSATVPVPGGVGRARKSGMDGFVSSLSPDSAERAWIASLDADSPVDPDYLAEIAAFFERGHECSAVTIGFRHRPGSSPEEERAIRQYEAYLARYVEKLRIAGSPYAFPTVGSAFAVRVSGYLRCGGMRVRSGGEDFYFLQAAAKCGTIGAIERNLVFPSPRPSDRVPFGTGPAVRNLMNGGTLREISDEAFDVLREVLSLNPETLPDSLPARVRPFFDRENFTSGWESICRNTPHAKRREAFHCFFDGLKTLRLLHYLDGIN